MKAKRIFKGAAIFLALLLSFLLILSLIQPFFTPKDMWDGTAGVNDFYLLEKNSLDLLFLGASQVFCSVNTDIFEEQGIHTYNFCSSAQRLATTSFYEREALKRQTPKVIVVEICEFFYLSPIEEKDIVWSYASAHPSLDKFYSLCEVLDGDILRAATIAFFPLFLYHSRWNLLSKLDLTMPLIGAHYDKMTKGGYYPYDTVKPQTLSYFGEEEGERPPVPASSDKAIAEIAARAEEKGIPVLFYKSPDAAWTRGQEAVVEEYMREHGFAFLNLFDHVEEMELNSETDFRDEYHLNSSGADKLTRWLAGYLTEHYHLGA